MTPVSTGERADQGGSVLGHSCGLKQAAAGPHSFIPRETFKVGPGRMVGAGSGLGACLRARGQGLTLKGRDFGDHWGNSGHLGKGPTRQGRREMLLPLLFCPHSRPVERTVHVEETA